MHSWARIASLSDLCRLSRGKIPAIANAVQESVFGALLEACPEPMRPTLANCLGELPEGSAADILKYVRELIALLTLEIANDEPDQTLFSLERNEIVSLLLAIFEILIAESSEEVSELLAKRPDIGAGGGSPLDFIDRCLDGDFGRTQLVQAVDVCLEMNELHRARAGLNAVKGSTEREVDLLHRHARLAYLSSPDAANGDVAAWAVKELQLFSALQHLARNTLEKDPRAAKLEAIALWQDAVIGTASLISHRQVGPAIGKLFKPRVIQVQSSIVLALPGWPNHPKLTASLYRDLLWEVGEDVDAIRFDRAGLPASFGIAPWFHADRKRMRPKMPWLPHAASLFVRIASWSVAACELLTSKSHFDPEDEGIRYLGYYLLHAYHWLDALERAFRRGHVNIEEGIYHVASAARLIVEQVAGGRYEHPSPAFFFQLTNLAAEKGFFSTDSIEIDVEGIFRKQDSIDRQFETALVLAQRALAVTEDEPRSGRWLEDAGNLSDQAIVWFAGRKRVPVRARYIARCFKRFFEKETMPEDLQEKDPLDSVHRSGTWTSIYSEHRAVLLKDAVSHLNWTCGENQIPVADSGYAAPLTVAVQRIVAASCDPSTPPELRDNWIADFRRLLAAAVELKDFDRFLQCRFVEVLQMRFLRGEVDLASMIISRLLEFGSNYTFAALIHWLQKDPVESDFDANLRIQIFDTLSRYIRALEAARERTEEPQTPDSRARHTARARVLERLAAASLIPPPQEGRPVNAAILVAARDKRDLELARLLEDRGTSIPVEINDRGLTLPIPQEYAAHDLRTANLVAFDATQLTVRRLGPPQSGPDGHNLFAGASLNPKSGQSYLGIVITPSEPDTKVAFDAISEAVGPANTPLAFQQGQIISADCELINHNRIVSADIKSVRELGQVHRIERWTVSAAPRADSLGFDFRARSLNGKDVRLTQQTVNLLAVFSLLPEFAPFDIRFAVDRDSERGTPVIGRFTDLLLDEAEQFNASLGIVLCLRSIVRSERGTISEIEVETSPYRYYRLRPQSDLTDATVGVLETTFSGYGSDDEVTGLFIAMRLAVDEKGPQLSLSPEGSAIQPHWSTTALHTPFDDRNLRWRNLFIAQANEDEASDLLTESLECGVREVGRDYLAKLPAGAHVDGFPHSAIIQFPSRPRSSSLILAIVDRERDGSPYTGMLYADEVSVSSLAKLDPAALKRLVEWLIDGEQERSFRIRRFVKNVSRLGLVRAFTAENLSVLLPAESLSLIPIKDSLSSSVWEVREAIGRPRFRRSNASPRFDVAHVPEEAFESDIARGVLTSIPLKGDAPCIVAWLTGETVEQRSLLIENLAEVGRRQLDLGSRVTVDRRSMPPVLTLDEPQISAEALWQISDPVGLADPATFVGTAHIDGRGLCDLFEVAPGDVTYAPVSSRADPVFSRFSNAHLTECSIIGLTDWSGSRPPDTFRHAPVWRVAYAIERGRGSDAKLCGFSATKRHATGHVRLTGYELEVEVIRSAGKVRIRRRLRARADEGNLRSHVPVQDSSPRVQVNESERLQRERARLLALWRSAPYVEGHHDEERNVFTPSDPFAQRLIPEGVAIAPSGFSRRSPFGPTSGYSRYRARISLRESDPLVGSYLDIPAAGIDDLIFALGNPPEGAVSKVGELALCYVGIDQSPDGKILHLFEWGYGWWTRLDPEFLRYKGRPIEEGELVLAFGDWIKSVRLTVENDATIISIEDIDLAPSHVLYKQAKDRILHVLRVSSAPNGDVKIVGLDAFDSRQATSIIRPFHHVGAALDPETEQEIGKLLAGKPISEGHQQTVTVYGRMDRDKFRNTGGTEIVYRAIHTGAKSKGGFDRLQPGDRIFVRASATKPMPNDLALRVSPLSNVEYVRADPNVGDRKSREDDWLVTRRLFSYDESALARITSGTGNELENRVLLVRLEAGRRGRFSLFHLDGAPARSSDLLDGLLAQAHGRLFCVFAGHGRGEAKGAVLLEVRPGARIEMERHKVEWPDEALEIGDILRLERRTENTGAPYRAVFGIFNDRRYARARRPVVALPKNPLHYLIPPFKDDNAVKEALANFGAGDFRQLSIALDVSGPDASGVAVDVLESFMKLPHPKLAWLQTKVVAEGRGHSILSPDFGNNILAGRLEFDMPGEGASSQVPRIRAVSLNTGGAEIGPLQWSESTFADASAKQILENVAKAGWHYHDRQTIVWRRTSDDRVMADPVPVGRHSVKTGPLFFERNGDAATLRFRPDQIERHLIGFANLRGSLPPAKRPSARGVVAYAAPGGGLYVEFIPGRIYEVPSALCSSDEQDSISLDRLDWNVFATGDRIGLRRAPEQAGRHGQEGVLLWWDHGVRNAIGPQGALMPRRPLERQPDSAVYGAGRFIVTLPTDPSETLPDLALVGGKAALRPIAPSDSMEDRRRMPVPGTTVLLSLRDGKNIEIEGLPGFGLAPATETARGKQINWQMDSLLRNSISHEKNRPTVRWDLIFERLKIVGGTLPVTLEAIHDDDNGKKCVLFSRRHQNLTLQEGAYARASVVGFIAKGNLVVLAVGGRHLETPISRVIDGAPKEMCCEIVEALARANAKVWLRQVGNRFHVGLKDETSNNFAVRTFARISSKANESQSGTGLVCVGTISRRLYWLPASEIGATRLTPAQLAVAFPFNGPAINALRVPEVGGISLIRDTRLKNEMRRLRPGVVTSVRAISDAIEPASSALPQFIGPTPGKATLARLTGTGLMISLLLEDDDVASDSPISVEITWRWHEGAALRITAVKRGKRKTRSDIPEVLLKPATHLDLATDIIYFGSGSEVGKKADAFGSSATEDLNERAASIQGEEVCSLRAALIVLKRLGENSSDAASQKAFWILASDIGKRTLRSFHLEPLAKRHAVLLRRGRQEDMAPGLNKRVEELLDMVTSSSGSAPADQISERLEALVLFATLYPQPDRATHFVHALSAALGGDHDLNVLLEGSGTIRQVTTLLRPFGLRMSTLSPAHRERLVASTAAACAKIEERLVEDDFDVPLPRGFTMFSQ